MYASHVVVFATLQPIVGLASTDMSIHISFNANQIDPTMHDGAPPGPSAGAAEAPSPNQHPPKTNYPVATRRPMRAASNDEANRAPVGSTQSPKRQSR